MAFFKPGKVFELQKCSDTSLNGKIVGIIDTNYTSTYSCYVFETRQIIKATATQLAHLDLDANKKQEYVYSLANVIDEENGASHQNMEMTEGAPPAYGDVIGSMNIDTIETTAGNQSQRALLDENREGTSNSQGLSYTYIDSHIAIRYMYVSVVFGMDSSVARFCLLLPVPIAVGFGYLAYLMVHQITNDFYAASKHFCSYWDTFDIDAHDCYFHIYNSSFCPITDFVAMNMTQRLITESELATALDKMNIMYRASGCDDEYLYYDGPEVEANYSGNCWANSCNWWTFEEQPDGAVILTNTYLFGLLLLTVAWIASMWIGTDAMSHESSSRCYRIWWWLHFVSRLTPLGGGVIIFFVLIFTCL